MSRHTIHGIDLIVVHHTASNPDSTTFYDVEEWHKERGWGQIGYHRLVTADGMCWDGRPIQQRGAHAPPNANRLGLCVTGNNTVPEQRWNTRQWARLRDELEYWLRRFPDARWCGHRDVKATECPGLDLRTAPELETFGYFNRYLEG